jgi:ABC-2 type transport system ATP-binding protein
LRVSNGEKLIPRLIELIRKRGGRVQAVSLRKPTLEDVFIRYTGRAIREEEVKPSKTRRRMMARMGG